MQLSYKIYKIDYISEVDCDGSKQVVIVSLTFLTSWHLQSIT